MNRVPPPGSPLAHFVQSVNDHKAIRDRVRCSFGDSMKIEPTDHGYVELHSSSGCGGDHMRSITLNVAEMEWLHSQLGRILGK